VNGKEIKRHNSDRKESITIVMPTYNEEEIIEEVVRGFYGKVLSHFNNWEFIIVDDCSTDTSGEILDKLVKEIPLRVIHLQKNRGHGIALRTALDQVQKEWIFHCDSDNQFYPEDFWKLWEKKDNNDIVIGYRQKRHDPLHRLLITRLVRLINYILFGVYLKDANSPFKLMKKTSLDEILKYIPKNVFAPSIMITVLSKKLGKHLIEVPVRHLLRVTGKISIVKGTLVKACLRSTKELFILSKKWNMHRAAK